MANAFGVTKYEKRLLPSTYPFGRKTGLDLICLFARNCLKKVVNANEHLLITVIKFTFVSAPFDNCFDVNNTMPCLIRSAAVQTQGHL